MLEILYQDEYLIAINKPHGLLVHRSSIAADAEEFALQLLRDQTGKKVNPAHRIVYGKPSKKEIPCCSARLYAG
jgi:tRNA pseudouridine65 synthase